MKRLILGFSLLLFCLTGLAQSPVFPLRFPKLETDGNGNQKSWTNMLNVQGTGSSIFNQYFGGGAGLSNLNFAGNGSALTNLGVYPAYRLFTNGTLLAPDGRKLSTAGTVTAGIQEAINDMPRAPNSDPTNKFSIPGGGKIIVQGPGRYNCTGQIIIPSYTNRPFDLTMELVGNPQVMYNGPGGSNFVITTEYNGATLFNGLRLTVTGGTWLMGPNTTNMIFKIGAWQQAVFRNNVFAWNLGLTNEQAGVGGGYTYNYELKQPVQPGVVGVWLEPSSSVWSEFTGNTFFGLACGIAHFGNRGIISGNNFAVGSFLTNSAYTYTTLWTNSTYQTPTCTARFMGIGPAILYQTFDSSDMTIRENSFLKCGSSVLNAGGSIVVENDQYFGGKYKVLAYDLTSSSSLHCAVYHAQGGFQDTDNGDSTITDDVVPPWFVATDFNTDSDAPNAFTIVSNSVKGLNIWGDLNASNSLTALGRVTFKSGSPGINKVWTSDANGLGSWQAAAGASATNAVATVLTNGSNLNAGVISNLNIIGNGSVVVTGIVASGQANIGITDRAIQTSNGSGTNTTLTGAALKGIDSGAVTRTVLSFGAGGNGTIQLGDSGSDGINFVENLISSSATANLEFFFGANIGQQGTPGTQPTYVASRATVYVGDTNAISVSGSTINHVGLTNGTIALPGGSPANGKVLMSDAAGDATWSPATLTNTIAAVAGGVPWVSNSGVVSLTQPTNRVNVGTGTMPSDYSDYWERHLTNYTGAAYMNVYTGTNSQYGLTVVVQQGDGSTSNSDSYAIIGENKAPPNGGEGIWNSSDGQFGAFGFYLWQVGGLTNGDVAGLGGRSASTASRQGGVVGTGVAQVNGQTNYGGEFLGITGGFSGTHVGVYAGLSSGAVAPFWQSAALVADNGDTTQPIFIGSHGGSAKVLIDSTGAQINSVSLQTPRLTVTTSNFNAGYISYATNQSQIQPDFSIPVQLMSTNAAFTFLAPKNVDTLNKTYQIIRVFVTNTTASAVAVTAPANCNPVGTMFVTNLTLFDFDCYAGAFTNVYARPLR
jgi:hypothetical protein